MRACVCVCVCVCVVYGWLCGLCAYLEGNPQFVAEVEVEVLVSFKLRGLGFESEVHHSRPHLGYSCAKEGV